MSAAAVAQLPAAHPAVSAHDAAADLATWVRAVHARAAELPRPRASYLVVTPLGWRDRGPLRTALESSGAGLLHRRPLPCWPAVASALYLRRLDTAALARAVQFEEAWAALVPPAPAEAWAVAPGSHRRIEAVKHAVRSGMRHLRIHLAPGASAVLHPFHLADLDDADEEARRLEAALELLRA